MANNHKALDTALAVGVGVLSGLGTDYLWSTLKLPGYGQIAFPIGLRNDGESLDMGVDDLIEIGIGGAVTAYGVYRKAKKKNGTNTIVGGLGFIGGVLLTKVFEKYGAGVTPIAVAEVPTGLVYVSAPR